MVRISLREISRDGGKADEDPKLLEFTVCSQYSSATLRPGNLLIGTATSREAG